MDLLTTLYPQRCVFCGDAVKPGAFVCRDCAKSVRPIEDERCPLCARPKKRCDCRGRARFYDAAATAFVYEGRVRDCVRRWKFGENGDAAAVLASATADCVAKVWPGEAFDCVCHVPQTADETAERGFDQTLLLAELVGMMLCLPVSDALVKRYATKKQHDLPMLERTGNVFGAFDCEKRFDGLRVLLVDDIMTTGSTMNECAKMLRLAGSETIHCAAAAVAVTEKTRK